ncbi:MAG: hypothetical protein QXE81_01235 [Desulfurococcaceae archaeon]
MLSSRKLNSLFIVVIILTALLVSYPNQTLLISGIALFAILIMYLTRQVDEYLDKRDSTGLYIVVSLAITIGSIIGIIINRSLYSSLIALSIVISLLTYGLVLVRGLK